MARRIKDIVQIDRPGSLDELIDALVAVRDGLPADAQAELLLRGCDVFGRHIAVSYMRPQTPEEAACEARYSGSGEAKPGKVSAGAIEAAREGYGRLRAVA